MLLQGASGSVKAGSCLDHVQPAPVPHTPGQPRLSQVPGNQQHLHMSHLLLVWLNMVAYPIQQAIHGVGGCLNGVIRGPKQLGHNSCVEACKRVCDMQLQSKGCALGMNTCRKVLHSMMSTKQDILQNPGTFMFPNSRWDSTSFQKLGTSGKSLASKFLLESIS